MHLPLEKLSVESKMSSVGSICPSLVVLLLLRMVFGGRAGGECNVPKVYKSGDTEVNSFIDELLWLSNNWILQLCRSFWSFPSDEISWTWPGSLPPPEFKKVEIPDAVVFVDWCIHFV